MSDLPRMILLGDWQREIRAMFPRVTVVPVPKPGPVSNGLEVGG